MVNLQCNYCGKIFQVDIEPFQYIPKNTRCPYCKKIWKMISDLLPIVRKVGG